QRRWAQAAAPRARRGPPPDRNAERDPEAPPLRARGQDLDIRMSKGTTILAGGGRGGGEGGGFGSCGGPVDGIGGGAPARTGYRDTAARRLGLVRAGPRGFCRVGDHRAA